MGRLHFCPTIVQRMQVNSASLCVTVAVLLVFSSVPPTEARGSHHLDIKPTADEVVESPQRAITRALFAMYQGGASLSKGQSCPMSPSCSEYGRLAVRHRGLLIGVLLTADRLHRCGHDLQWYPPAWNSAGLRAADQVPER